MNNTIVGLSKDHSRSVGNIQQTDVLIQTLKNINDSISNHEDRIVRMEDTMRANGIQEQKITEAVNRVVVQTLGGKDSPSYQDKSVRAKAYSEINRRIKKRFGVPRRGEVPAKNFNDCMQLINSWKPDYELQEDIDATNGQLDLLANDK